MLCARALLIFLLFSEAMNAFLAAWIAFKSSCIIWDDGLQTDDDILQTVFRVECLTQGYFWRALCVTDDFVDHVFERLIIAFDSTITPGDSAVVVLMLIPIYSLILIIFICPFPPLSIKILSDDSFTDINMQKIVFTTVSLLLLGIKIAANN